MKVTVGEVVLAWETIKIRQLPANMSNEVSFRLGLIAKKIKDEWDQYNEELEKLRAKYGKAKTDGGPPIVDSKGENYPAFAKEVDDLLRRPIEDLHAYTIKLSLLCPKTSEDEDPEKGLAQVIQGIFPFIVDDLGMDEEEKPRGKGKAAEDKGGK